MNYYCTVLLVPASSYVEDTPLLPRLRSCTATTSKPSLCKDSSADLLRHMITLILFEYNFICKNTATTGHTIICRLDIWEYFLPVGTFKSLLMSCDYVHNVVVAPNHE